MYILPHFVIATPQQYQQQRQRQRQQQVTLEKFLFCGNKIK